MVVQLLTACGCVKFMEVAEGTNRTLLPMMPQQRAMWNILDANVSDMTIRTREFEYNGEQNEFGVPIWREIM